MRPSSSIMVLALLGAATACGSTARRVAPAVVRADPTVNVFTLWGQENKVQSRSLGHRVYDRDLTPCSARW